MKTISGDATSEPTEYEEQALYAAVVMMKHFAAVEAAALRDQLDLHRLTVAFVLGIPYNDVLPWQRTVAKHANFHRMYSATGCSD